MSNFFSIKAAVWLLIIWAIVGLNACSKGHEGVPTNPSIPNSNESEFADVAGGNRQVIAVFDALIDPSSGTFTIEPVSRETGFHLPLSNYLPNALKILNYGFTPNFWADIKLQHPYPGSGIDVFDPRVIAILPAKPGVSFNYPTLDANANNKVLLEPDGYTKLFDSLGGAIPGNTNPFKAYFKNQPNRVWSSTGVISETQRWNMNLSGFGGTLTFKLVVDISTNYPNPPQPGIDNALEPVEMDATVGDGLTIDGGDTSVEVSLLDWHDFGSLGDVEVESPSLFDSKTKLSFYSVAPQTNKYYFRGAISNMGLAPEGEYDLLVKSSDRQSGIPIYDEFKAKVRGQAPGFPLNVTPPWLNFDLLDVSVQGDYAYIAATNYGFHIIDISDLSNPTWVNWIDTLGYARRVVASGDYAYVAQENKLLVIDIDPPESAQIVKIIDTVDSAQDLFISNGYAYVADNRAGLQIIDIDPLNSASIVKTINTYQARDVDVSGGYAYVADRGEGLKIIDIDPIESAYVVSSLDIPSEAYNVCYSNGYVYLGYLNCLHIVDVHTPWAPYIAKTIVTDDSVNDVQVVGQYAYFTCTDSGLRIMDIQTPENACVIKQVDTPGYANGLQIRGDYAFIADGNSLQIININPPSSSSIFSYFETLNGSLGVDVSDNYAYVCTGTHGFKIVDITDPESPRILKTVYTPGSCQNVHVVNGYAYVADDLSGLEIIDVDPIETANIVRTVKFADAAKDVYVSNGYAYVASWFAGLQIVDIDPPESAHIVKSVITGGNSNGVHVSGNYAYIADSNPGQLVIINIDPPESASIVKSMNTPDTAYDVFVCGGYGYVTDSSDELHIVDIDPPDAAHIVKSIDTGFNPRGLYIERGFAFVADGNSGLKVVDIEPFESAHVSKSIDTPGYATGVDVSGDYAFLACDGGGLQIINLRW